ncbi:MFS transporter [Nocardia sp. NEAU-G5]|uniref:MFS transporter n=1 Tax=Nocardia albiluteola TaxID=2842303 RepID=A0ABS6AY76_9NOCA|nr:MFS transporter [Nocardia albiluteola]MBU3061945.1 MFS transporter [Nocardia albiluteola]
MTVQNESDARDGTLMQASGTGAPASRPAPNTPGNPQEGHPRRWAIMGVLSTVASMALLDFFVVNVSLDGMSHSYPGSGISALSWVLNAYAIVFAAALVPAGRIADLWGRKRVLLTGIAVFTAASVLAAAAPDLAVLIIARAIQAVGAAMIVPTTLGLLLPSFNKRQHTLVVGLWAGTGGVAASAGPPIGGLLVSISWRWIFLINLPIGIATIIAGAILLPEIRQPKGTRLPDPASVIGLFAAVGLLILATVQGPAWGWGNSRTIGLFIAAAVAAVATLQRTLRAASPVIEKRLFESRIFTASAVGLILFSTGFSIFLLGGALFMQNIWHYSALRAGSGIAPAPVVSIVFAVLAGPINKRFGRVLPTVTGTLAMTVAAVIWLLTVNTGSDYWTSLFPGLIAMGIAGGLTWASMYAAAGTLPPDRATTGSAVLNMGRQIGAAIGIALLVVLTVGGDPIADYHHAWILQAALGVLAAGTIIAFGRQKKARGW